MSFSTLREKLMQPPSQMLFTEICQLFEQWKGCGLEAALQYAEEHMQEWEPETRYTFEVDWSRELPVWWPLVRSYCHINETIPTQWQEESHPLMKLKHLSMNCEGHNILDIPSTFPNLVYLELYGCNKLQNIEALGHLTSLVHLKMSLKSGMEDIQPVSNLTNLTHLDLSESHSLKSLDALRTLTNITYVDLSECHNVVDIEPLKKLTKLTKLDLYECEGLKNVDALAHLPKLSSLSLEACTNLLFRPDMFFMDSRKDVILFQEKLLEHIAKPSA